MSTKNRNLITQTPGHPVSTDPDRAPEAQPEPDRAPEAQPEPDRAPEAQKPVATQLKQPVLTNEGWLCPEV